MFVRVAQLVAGPFALFMGVAALVAEFTVGARGLASVFTMVAVVFAVAAVVLDEVAAHGSGSGV